MGLVRQMELYCLTEGIHFEMGLIAGMVLRVMAEVQRSIESWVSSWSPLIDDRLIECGYPDRWQVWLSVSELILNL